MSKLEYILKPKQNQVNSIEGVDQNGGEWRLFWGELNYLCSICKSHYKVAWRRCSDGVCVCTDHVDDSALVLNQYNVTDPFPDGARRFARDSDVEIVNQKEYGVVYNGQTFWVGVKPSRPYAEITRWELAVREHRITYDAALQDLRKAMEEFKDRLDQLRKSIE